MLEFRNIYKSFTKSGKQINILNDVQFVANKGDFIALQGASGCGKTTLLLIAGGLLKPNSGQILFKYKNLYSKSIEERAKLRSTHFGYVFQQYHLIPYLTILENILLPTLANKKEDDNVKALELIEKLGLLNRLNHLPSELSAGEKQRASLARAMLHSPSILFADEITGNLDEKNSIIVINELKNFSNSGGIVLFVTHDYEKAKSADKVINIIDGRLI